MRVKYRYVLHFVDPGSGGHDRTQEFVSYVSVPEKYIRNNEERDWIARAIAHEIPWAFLPRTKKEIYYTIQNQNDVQNLQVSGVREMDIPLLRDTIEARIQLEKEKYDLALKYAQQLQEQTQHTQQKLQHTQNLLGKILDVTTTILAVPVAGAMIVRDLFRHNQEQKQQQKQQPKHIDRSRGSEDERER